MAIQDIEKEFERLSNLVLEQLQLLDELFTTNKKHRPGEIFKILRRNEEKIDRFEIEIDDGIIKTIVLYQPVATDLRRLFAIYNMTINLERVGDLVHKIACTCMDIWDSELLEESKTALRSTLKITSKMVNKALLSFVNNDQAIARRTLRTELAFDQLNKKFLKRIIKEAGLQKKSQAILNNLVDMRSMLASLERIGDHATNIAEASIYAISGSDIRHGELKNE